MDSQFAVDLPPLQDVLPVNAGLTSKDKRTLLQQAHILLEVFYTHLHLKTAMYGINPIQRLKLLQFRLENPEDEINLQELEFHRELLSIFHSLHDLHTNYILPLPYRRFTAILPFLVEEYFDAQNKAHYVVTKINRDFQHEYFKIGVEIQLWNGLPIAEAIRRHSENESGSNAAARFAVGLRSLTIRPLALSLPPEEVYIRLRYQTEDKQTHDIEFEWLTLQAGARSRAERGSTLPDNIFPEDIHEENLLPILPSPESLHYRSLLGNNLQAHYINLCREHLYAATSSGTGQPAALSDLEETSLPELIRAGTLKTPHGTFAYLRLFSFMVSNLEGFLKEVKRLLEALPQNGLILDVRGNSGGLITAAENLLQYFTPYPITPEKAQFRSEPLIRNLCKRNAPSPLAPQINLGAWVPSLDQAHISGALYSTGHSLTTTQEANATGQIYTAPVVLVTDAYCYSATDMFAAGFQDHNIGKIIGANDNTGAGGANVWQHLLLRVLSKAPHLHENSPPDLLTELPRFADFRVSSRRMLRAQERDGMALEDFGVQPDERHYMTRQDILEGNVDLFNAATRLLSEQKPYQLLVKAHQERCELQLETQNIDRIDWFIDSRAAGSMDIENNTANLKLPESNQRREILLRGYENGQLVASKQERLLCSR